MSQNKKRSAGILVSLVAVLVGVVIWNNASDRDASKGGAATTGSSSECEDMGSISPDHMRCRRSASSGFTALIAEPSQLVDVVLVGPGGPIISEDSAIEVLRNIAGKSQFRNSELVLLVPPEPASLTTECRSANASDAAKACEFDQLLSLYTEEYANAVNEVVSTGRPVDLLGASFASARWSTILLNNQGPDLRSSVIVSPFNFGLKADVLEKHMSESAQAIFTSIVESECASIRCLDSVEVDAYSCSQPYCELVEEWSAMSGLGESDVALGLIGLAPLADVNGPRLVDAVESGDSDRLRDLLESGNASALGVDAFGDRHVSNVHLLAGVCATFEEGSSFAKTALWQDCAGVEHAEPNGARPNLLDEPSTGIPRACFLGTQPDPILGSAVSEGRFFGNGSETILLQGKGFGHGNLEVAAEILGEVRRDLKAPPCGSKSSK